MEAIISIDFNKRCQECKELGATQNGLCIDCIAKFIKRERRRRKQKEPLQFVIPDGKKEVGNDTPTLNYGGGEV